jgi:hypothetical protein
LKTAVTAVKDTAGSVGTAVSNAWGGFKDMF